MLLTRCAKSLTPRLCGTWYKRAAILLGIARSSRSLCVFCEAIAAGDPCLDLDLVPNSFIVRRHLASTAAAPIKFSVDLQSIVSDQQVLNRSAQFCCRRSGSFRHFSSSSRGDPSHVAADSITNNHIKPIGGKGLEPPSNGRFQEEVSQSLDYDSARINLHSLISNPADLKGLHETLQKASHSTGDKEVMSMTIEDIQKILKDEFRRRASQTASVEIWKALLVVGGLVFVLYWGRIGQDIAGETARVTTLTLEDEQLQAKAFELANVIVNNVLTNPNVVDQAAVFLQIAVANLAAKPETQDVLLQITQNTLAQLISQESTLTLISDLLGRAAIQALDDPAVKSKVADTVAWVLQEKYVIDQSAKLASSTSVETLSDEAVQKQSKEFLEHMLEDENIKKKTAAAVWGVIGNMFLPAFLFKSTPSTSKPDAEQQSLSTTVTNENDSSAKPRPWYHFSGVLGWVLPSFRKSPDLNPTEMKNILNDASVSDPSPGSTSLSPLVPDSDSSIQSPELPNGPSPTAPIDVRMQRSSSPSAVSTITRDNSSDSNAFCESNRVQSVQIPSLPPHFALLVPPSSADEGDNSFTDDDRRGTSNCERKP